MPYHKVFLIKGNVRVPMNQNVIMGGRLNKTKKIKKSGSVSDPWDQNLSNMSLNERLNTKGNPNMGIKNAQRKRPIKLLL